MRILTKTLFFAGIFPFFQAFAQQAEPAGPPRDWFLLDPETDNVQGTSTEKAYTQLLKDRPAKKVIVAVIDSGVDIEHEDLQGKIWKNEKEIAGNGMDDDQNGYVDDVHGWNFIGGKNGNVSVDTHELTREYNRLKKKWGAVDTTRLEKNQVADYQSFVALKRKFEALRDKNREQYQLYANAYANLKKSIDTLRHELQTEELTAEALKAYTPESIELKFAKGYVNHFLTQTGSEAGLMEHLEQLRAGAEYYQPIAEYAYNDQFDPRAIVGDDPANLNERGYGNNDVRGPDAQHGTHVAGIIAANRQNDAGIKGIADPVIIMPVRAVPNGDERDKDVANAIRYAVDNGARIINMSFGKSYSPQKEAVDAAVQYAESKNVLLIHAAGNDGDNNDVDKNYPNPFLLNGQVAKNWIEVGASSWGADEDFVASFSNYGKKSVNIFAPGVEMYSTIPGSQYEVLQGTSMASPVVAGVAALVLAYYPELTAVDLRKVILDSSRQFDNLEIVKPGGGRARFSDLSTTGGIVNSYEALLLAEKISKAKKSKR
ncbi:MAG: S8 family peptidase [Cyclobacteriaceae bacterium]|jgi:subtilisin family serine protease|nr:S8 family peptidase [Cyclobacteriaceae bacterium]